VRESLVDREPLVVGRDRPRIGDRRDSVVDLRAPSDGRGGLVEAGRHLDRHLAYALELARLCSGDPVCAQHRPDNASEPARALHGAACHSCQLIGEPSCERRNELLDRALVVPTFEHPDLAFFR